MGREAIPQARFSNRDRISVDGPLRCLFSSWLAALHAAALYFLEKAILATRPPGPVAASFGRARAARGVCRPK
jgi:hypothetical protein